MTKIKVTKVAVFVILSMGLFFSFAAVPAQANGVVGVLDSSTYSDESDICETGETLVFFTDKQYCLEAPDFDGLILRSETHDEYDSVDLELCNYEDSIPCEALQPIDCDDTPSHWVCSCTEDVKCLPPIYWFDLDSDCDDAWLKIECMEKKCEETPWSPECFCRYAICLPESEAIFTWPEDPGWVDPPQENGLPLTILLDVIENLTNSDEDFIPNYVDLSATVIIAPSATTTE